MDLRSIVAWRSVLSGGIFVTFLEIVWYDKTKGAGSMNDIATLGNDAGFSVFLSGIMSSDSRHPTRWSGILP